MTLQVGTDVDPLAVKAAKDNAALNSVGDRLIALQCSPSVEVSSSSLFASSDLVLRSCLFLLFFLSFFF